MKTDVVKNMSISLMFTAVILTISFFAYIGVYVYQLLSFIIGDMNNYTF